MFSQRLKQLQSLEYLSCCKYNKTFDNENSNIEPLVIGTIFHVFQFSKLLLSSVGLWLREHGEERMKLGEEMAGNPVSGDIREKVGPCFSRYLLARLPGSGQNGLQLTEIAEIAATFWNVPGSFKAQKYPHW